MDVFVLTRADGGTGHPPEVMGVFGTLDGAMAAWPRPWLYCDDIEGSWAAPAEPDDETTEAAWIARLPFRN